MWTVFKCRVQTKKLILKINIHVEYRSRQTTSVAPKINSLGNPICSLTCWTTTCWLLVTSEASSCMCVCVCVSVCEFSCVGVFKFTLWCTTIWEKFSPRRWGSQSPERPRSILPMLLNLCDTEVTPPPRIIHCCMHNPPRLHWHSLRLIVSASVLAHQSTMLQQ